MESYVVIVKWCNGSMRPLLREQYKLHHMHAPAHCDRRAEFLLDPTSFWMIWNFNYSFLWLIFLVHLMWYLTMETAISILNIINVSPLHMKLYVWDITKIFVLWRTFIMISKESFLTCVILIRYQKPRTNGHVMILLLLWSAACFWQLHLWLIVQRKFLLHLLVVATRNQTSR